MEHGQLLGLSLVCVIISFIEQKLYDTDIFFSESKVCVNLMESTPKTSV